jgi:ankyrin repeat protein
MAKPQQSFARTEGDDAALRGAVPMNAGPLAVLLLARSCRIGAIFALLLASIVAFCAPIHDAARKGDQAKVVALLSQNPELVFSRDKFGNTPLHLAALHNQPAVAALLLANGADVNARCIDQKSVPRTENGGETPLTLALTSYQHKEMLELLLTHGADPNVMLSNGDTPLNRAVSRDLPDDLELLLANGADPNTRGFNWQTAVHIAVWSKYTRILELLLDYGADPNVKDVGGHTPLYWAKSNHYDKGVALLIAHGGQ